MTYAAYEGSQQLGRPVELYTFTLGSTVNRYTNNAEPVVFQALTYFPRQVARSMPKQSHEQRRQQLEITLPTDDAVASPFIGIVPGERMTLRIVRTHLDDPDKEGLVLWDGRIGGASYTKDGTSCVLQGLTTEAAMSRTMPRFKYQGMCNHVLGDDACKIVLDPGFKYTGTATGVSSAVITVAGLLAAKGAGWAVGGYIAFASADWRLVISQNGDDCELMLNFEENVVGQPVEVYAGCDHSLDVCENTFSNVVNFGGFPYVPTRNPFSAGID